MHSKFPFMATRLTLSFATTFLAVFGTYKLAYTYLNLPIVVTELIILGIAMALCRAADQSDVKPIYLFTFFCEAIALWALSIPVFLKFLPVSSFGAIKWALAFSFLMCGFYFCLSRSLHNNKHKL